LRDNHILFSVNGENGLNSITSITFENVNIPLFLRETSSEFAIAQGSACSSKEIEASHVLSAIGLTRQQAENTLRMSFDHKTDISSVNRFVEALVSYKI
jgi:cysteine desulfurase